MIRIPLLLSLIALTFACCSEKTEAIKEVSLEAEEFPKPVTFNSKDGLLISGNLYHFSNKVPIILMCHQAGFNKFEYNEIANTVFEKGFNCLSIDQRSGGSVGDSINETYNRAKKAGKSTEFLDAEQDIEAAISYLRKKYKKKIIVWGSSYSATLALYQGLKNNDVEAVIAFSPGNYFGNERGDLQALLTEFHKPLFATSSKVEAPILKKMLSGIPSNLYTTQFTPKGEGQHGSKALWTSEACSSEYWEALNAFLSELK